MSNATWKSASIILFAVRADWWTSDKQFAPRHNVCGADARRTLLYFLLLYPVFRSLSLSSSSSSLFLPWWNGENVPRAREWTPRKKFVSVWCRARLTARVSSIVKSRRSVTNYPLTEEKVFTYGWFYDERFRSGHYKIRSRREKPTRS